ncbi:MAG: neutral/alkaline non-lysosomal ceramidase N-terminal domain-containing protein [Polyangiaceae bacterium]|nr:neutral/alkaline non-lysosomal ceramidase N-terminal domain-containing protein [Polyangiaceae bacterium]
MAFRRKLGWLGIGILATFVASCGTDNPDKPPPTVEPAVDVLAHCKFEKAPARPEKPANAPTEIKAGYGSVLLPIPIGSPLGGYTSRAKGLIGGPNPVDKRPQRFAKSFVPTVGMHDGLRAEVLALEAGGERVVLVRLDAPYVMENTVFELESKVAPDGSMRGHIVLSGSHSHSSWGGYQPSLVLMAGSDRPKQELAERFVDSVAGAIKEALDGMVPAKLGIHVEKAFDPMDEVNRDRRGDNDMVLGPDGNHAGEDKDTHLWIMRVDKLDGSPLAAIVDFPIHGTVSGGDNPLASTDATGGIVRSLEHELGHPVLHFQGAAGDVSPAGHGGRAACPDSRQCLDMPRLETLGARAAEIIAPLIKNVQTGDKAALEIATRTFYVGRDAVVKRPDGQELRYKAFDPEFVEPDRIIFDDNGKILSPIDEFNAFAGAGLCGEANGAGAIAPVPGTAGLKPYGSCLNVQTGGHIILDAFYIGDYDRTMPLCDTSRTTVSAIRISGTPTGDYMALTMPGEAVAPFASYLRARSPAGADKTLLIGYANDHVGYLLTAEDWLAGGYEPSINLWGPLEGEIVIDGILEAAKTAWTPEIEDPEVDSSRYTNWTYPDVEPITVVTTSEHGTVAPVPATIWWPDTADKNAPVLASTVSRAVGAARFVWYGGDVAIDTPEVFIEHETAPGQFETLKDSKGKTVSSFDGVIVTTYTPEPLESMTPEKHIFSATWQPVPGDPISLKNPIGPYSLPLGKYRFRVEGKAKAASGITSYSLTSESFEVVAAPLAASSTATRASTSVDVTANLGAATGIRALKVGPTDVNVPLLGPWTVIVTFANNQTKTVDVMPDASGKASVPLTMQEAIDAVKVDVRDSVGNGGSLDVL